MTYYQPKEPESEKEKESSEKESDEEDNASLNLQVALIDKYRKCLYIYLKESQFI